MPHPDPNAPTRILASGVTAGRPDIPAPTDAFAGDGASLSPSRWTNPPNHPTLTLRLAALPTGGIWFQLETGAGAPDNRSGDRFVAPTDARFCATDDVQDGIDEIDLTVSPEPQGRARGRRSHNARATPTSAIRDPLRSTPGQLQGRGALRPTLHHRWLRRLVAIGALAAAIAWVLLAPARTPRHEPSQSLTPPPTAAIATTRGTITQRPDATSLATIGPDSDPSTTTNPPATPLLYNTWLAAKTSADASRGTSGLPLSSRTSIDPVKPVGPTRTPSTTSNATATTQDDNACGR